VITQPAILFPHNPYKYTEVEKQIGVKAQNEHKLVFSPYSDYTMYDSDGSSLFVDYFNTLNNVVNEAVQSATPIRK